MSNPDDSRPSMVRIPLGGPREIKPARMIQERMKGVTLLRTGDLWSLECRRSRLGSLRWESIHVASSILGWHDGTEAERHDDYRSARILNARIHVAIMADKLETAREALESAESDLKAWEVGT